MNREEINTYIQEQNPIVKTIINQIEEVYTIKDTPTKIINMITFQSMMRIIKTYHQEEYEKLQALVIQDIFRRNYDEIFKSLLESTNISILEYENTKIKSCDPGSMIFQSMHDWTCGQSTKSFFEKINVKTPPIMIRDKQEFFKNVQAVFFCLMLVRFGPE